MNAPTPAARPERPERPVSGLSAAFEPIFTIVLTASFFVHAAMTLVFLQVDPPPPSQNADVVAFAKRMRIATVPIVPPTEAQARRMVKAPPEKKPEAVRKRLAVSPSTRKPSSRTDRIKQSAVIALLSSPGAMGGVGDVFAAKSPLADLSTDIRGTRGVRIGSGLTRRDATGPGGEAFVPADEPERHVARKGRVDTGRKKETPGVARDFRAEKPKPRDGFVDGREVARVIRGRREAFMQCYSRALKENARLAGKMRVEFVIAENGRVSDAATLGRGLGSRTLDRCVAGVVRRLRFAPRDEDVTVENAFVFTPAN